jgi:hypothetical protein
MKTGKEFIEFSPKHKKKKTYWINKLKTLTKSIKLNFFLKLKYRLIELALKKNIGYVR